MKDPRMKDVESQKGFNTLKRSAMKKSERRSQMRSHKKSRKRGGKY